MGVVDNRPAAGNAGPGGSRAVFHAPYGFHRLVPPPVLKPGPPKTLHRSITVQDLQWTWKEGMRIKGFEAADDPEYDKGPILSVDQLLLSVDF